MGFAARLLAVFALLACSAWPCLAQDTSIYSGEVEVASQDEIERESVLGRALTQALIRASGDPTIAQDPGLAAALAAAPGLLRQHSYHQQVENGQARLLLVAQFDPAGIERILRGLNRPMWDAARPVTVVWLVIDDGKRKTIANSGQVSALPGLTGHARQRGVPLRFPQLDSEDRAYIDPEMLWQGGDAQALKASARYQGQAALIARLTRAGNEWTGRFTYVDEGGSEHWGARHPQSSIVLVAAAEGLADRLAHRYAVSAQDRVVGDYQVWVGNLRSADDYADAIKYLQGLSVVRALTPIGAEGDRVLLKVTLEVSLNRLRRVFELGKVLAFDDTAPVEGAQASFRLLR